MKTVLVAVLVVLLAGCSWFLPLWKQRVPEGKAAMVVYRQPGLVAPLTGFMLVVDGHLWTALHNGEYTQIDLSPGVHVFSVKGSDARWVGNLQGARRYFLSLDVGGSTAKPLPTLSATHPAQAGQLLKNMRSVDRSVAAKPAKS